MRPAAFWRALNRSFLNGAPDPGFCILAPGDRRRYGPGSKVWLVPEETGEMPVLPPQL